MFYKIIERKRDEWLNSPNCVISELVSYIERQHKMRDAQIESDALDWIVLTQQVADNVVELFLGMNPESHREIASSQAQRFGIGHDQVRPSAIESARIALL